MKKIAGLSNQTLRWVQPNTFKMYYELRAKDELAATLHFRSAFGTFATAESEDGCWTFKRVGFFQTHVTIRSCDSGNELAGFHNNTWSGGGTLEFSDGREYPATSNFWQTRFEFQTIASDPLVRFKTSGLIHLSAQVEILPAASPLPELPLMVLLGWYLILMMQNDSTAAASTAEASA